MYACFFVIVWVPTVIVGVNERGESEGNLAIQSRIDQVTADLAKGLSPVDAFAVYERLRDLATRSPEEFVRQLLFYMSNKEKSSDEKLHALLAIAHFNLSHQTIIDAVSPYAYSDNEELASTAQRLLGMAEPDWRTEPGHDYESVLRAHKDDPPTGLIRYMYETSPRNALRILLGVYRDELTNHRQLLWADHVIGDYLWKKGHGFAEASAASLASASHELEAMAQDRVWWVRLYAAEIVRRNPELRSEKLKSLLENDEHQAVRKAVSRWKK